MKPTILTLAIFLQTNCMFSQNKVFEYPVSFDPRSIDSNWCRSYSVVDQNSKEIAVVLKDSRSAHYLHCDQNFRLDNKVISRNNFSGTIFEKENVQCVGGFSANGIARFLYGTQENSIYEETVDFTKGSIAVKKLFDKPKEEIVACSFMTGNVFRIMTINDAKTQLAFYEVTANGDLSKKVLDYPLPDYVDKKVVKLSDWIWQLKLVNEGDEVGLETGRAARTLYVFKEKLLFVMNGYESPTQLVTIALPSMAMTTQIISHDKYIQLKNGEHFYIKSSYADGKVFSLVSQKEKMMLLIYTIPDGKLIKQLDITSETSVDDLWQSPVFISVDKKTIEKPMTKMKEVIKNIYEGITVLAVNKAQDKWVLTIGHLDGFQRMNFSSSSGADRTVHTYQMRTPGTAAGVTNMIYTTWGNSSQQTTIAKPTGTYFYRATYFKMAINPDNLEPLLSKSNSIGRSDAIKKFIDEKSKNILAPAYFNLGDKDYYSYYDKATSKYIIEEIPQTR